MNEQRILRAFCSYSHKDEDRHQRLCTALAQLRREGQFETWHDGLIVPGQNWAEKILESLNRADIVLLLVSPDFLASDYSWNTETLRALQRHELGSVRVIPIILRPCDWKHSPIASFQALPKNGIPVSKHPIEDDAFLEIVEGIRRVIDELTSRPPCGDGIDSANSHENPGQLHEGAPVDVRLEDVPPGPMVPLYLIPDDLVRELANLLVERAEAIALLHAATGSLKQKDRSASIVELAQLPAFAAGSYQFWQSAFHEACKHGPRMVAALLLELPEGRMSDGVCRQRRRLLCDLVSGTYRIEK